MKRVAQPRVSSDGESAIQRFAQVLSQQEDL